MGSRQNRAFEFAVLAAFSILLGLTANGCKFNDDGPKTGPGLEPPGTNPGTVGLPTPDGPGTGSGPQPTPSAGTGGTSGMFGAPIGTAGTGASAAGMTGAMGPAAGTGAAGGPAGEPTTPPPNGTGGAGGSSSDGGPLSCEAARVTALGAERLIAPTADGGTSVPRLCEYALPDSAAPYLPDRVNLQHTVEGQHENIPRVAGVSECDPLEGGFYYDDADNPTRIIVCLASCLRLAEGEVEIVLGCPTVTRQ